MTDRTVLAESTSEEPPSAFSECDEVTDDKPMRQGDVFAWLSASSDPLAVLGLVVTADCDIAHAKHRGILSYVPILRLTDYLRLFHFPRVIERGLKPIVAELLKKILELQALNRPEFPEPISEQAAVRWVMETDLDEIANDLGLAEGKPRQRLIALGSAYRSAQAARQREEFDDQFEAIVRLRSKTAEAAKQSRVNLWSEISALVRDLPGDAFFIGRIASDFTTGYLAYLRLVREVRDDQIAIRQTDLLQGSRAVAKRIARLRSPYIFRLTQQLGTVFGAIGLPTEYEDHRQQLVQVMAARPKSGDEVRPDGQGA